MRIFKDKINKMKSNIDKSLILNRIKIRYSITKNVDLAKLLGITPQTLSTWISRNSIDYDLVLTKCENMNMNWLLTGEGSMLKTDSVMVSPGECLECKNKDQRIEMLQTIIDGKEALIESQKELIAELKKSTQVRPAQAVRRVAM